MDVMLPALLRQHQLVGALPASLVVGGALGQLLECLGRLAVLGQAKDTEHMFKELSLAWPADQLLVSLYQVQDYCPDIPGKVLAQITAGLLANHPQPFVWSSKKKNLDALMR